MIPKVVAFDLDGTLSVSKSPVEASMGELIAKLLEKTEVAIISGGKYGQFETQLFPALPPHERLDRLFLFPTSGAMCFRSVGGRWEKIYDHSFSPEERDHVMTVLKTSMEETGFAEAPTPVWGERIEDRGAQITFSALGQEAPPEAKAGWDTDKAKRTPLAAALTARLPGFSIRMNAATSIDITRKGITKAYAVRQLAEITGIPIADMLYIGDALFPGGNDEIVKETSIPTRQVQDPTETTALIEALLAAA